MRNLSILILFCSLISIKVLAQADTAVVPIIFMSSAPIFNNRTTQNFALWFYQNLEYPKSALKDSLSGKVIVKFLIDSTGTVKNIEILKGVRNDINDEVLKVLLSSPKWTPAKQIEKSISVPFLMPIEFDIRDPQFKNKIGFYSKYSNKHKKNTNR